jgi:hypothetical protein
MYNGLLLYATISESNHMATSCHVAALLRAGADSLCFPDPSSRDVTLDLRQASSDKLGDGAESVGGPHSVGGVGLLVDPGGLERGKGGEPRLDRLKHLLLGVEHLKRSRVCRDEEVESVRFCEVNIVRGMRDRDPLSYFSPSK